MWIVNRTRGSCQRTFMSYSRLFSLFRNKHKVKRKPSWDESGNKHFSDPTKTSPARKKNQTPPGNHDIDFWRRCTHTFATLKKHHPKLTQASFQFCTHWVSCTSQATKNAEMKVPAGWSARLRAKSGRCLAVSSSAAALTQITSAAA